jgi:hypothetical protein
VNVYDNGDFDEVANLADVGAATLVDEGVAMVNCPIVENGPEPVDPGSADSASIDRFSDEAGVLLRRDSSNGLPAADEPIDFDEEPFLVQGLGPAGEVVRHYNFDVQSGTPAPMYTLVREAEGTPIPGQYNIFGAVPGDADDNDLRRVTIVTVPNDYVANVITSVEEIEAMAYPMEETNRLVNRPIVPDGSTATLRLNDEDAELRRGWYDGMLVHYFAFNEADLTVTMYDEVPVSTIYVTFNINPDETDGGWPSGFVTEPGSPQTHNVIATLPGDPNYSPVWLVGMYDNADFDSVTDLSSATAADLLIPNAAMVNLPVVEVE